MSDAASVSMTLFALGGDVSPKITALDYPVQEAWMALGLPSRLVWSTQGEVALYGAGKLLFALDRQAFLDTPEAALLEQIRQALRTAVAG